MKFFTLVDPDQEEDRLELEGEERMQEDSGESRGAPENNSDEKIEMEVECDRTEDIQKRQAQAMEKQKLRDDTIGQVLRSKGLVWTTHAHDLKGLYSQAGTAVTVACIGDTWDILNEKAWTGSETEKKALRKNFVEPWGDRRQEIVFIGIDMKADKVQEFLDECLLTDEELEMGLDGWKAVWGDMFLPGPEEMVEVGSDDDDKDNR